MGSDFEAEYFPQVDQVKMYSEFMEEYSQLANFVENKIKSKKLSMVND
jgi:L-ribulokinase